MSEQKKIHEARETAFAMGLLVLLPIVATMAYLGVNYSGGFEAWVADHPFWKGVILIAWAGWFTFVYEVAVRRHRPNPEEETK